MRSDHESSCGPDRNLIYTEREGQSSIYGVGALVGGPGETAENATRTDRSERSDLEAGAGPPLARPGALGPSYSDRGRGLPAGNLACRQAVPPAWSGPRVDRGCAPQARSKARQRPRSRRCRPGVRPTTGGPVTMDATATGRGGWPEGHRGQRRLRDNPGGAGQARLEALAGKKCGACLRSIRSSSIAWKTCFSSTRGRTDGVSP